MDEIQIKQLRDDNVELQNFIFQCFRESSVFTGKYDRIESSGIICVIYNHDELIGFLSLNDEKVENVLFMDIFIIDRYRGRGYGTKACEKIKELYSGDDFIVAETEINNVSANKSLQKSSFFLLSENDLNYYLVSKERIDEFRSGNSFEQLKRHIVSGMRPRAYQYVRSIIDKG